MLLTAQQLQEIRQMIADRTNAFVVNVFGPEAVAPEVVAALRAQGLIDVEMASLTDAYIYGKVAALLGEARTQTMTYPEFRAYVKAHPQPLNAAESHAVAVAQTQAGALCQGLGNTIDKATGALLIEADAALRRQTMDTIATKTAENIAKRQTIAQLKSELGHATGDWTRNLNRIAVTETHNAMQQGLAAAIRAENGAEARVFKRLAPGACETCLKLLVGPDGAPRIFTLSALQHNGTNQGKKADDLRATVGPLHPNCLPPFTRISTASGMKDIQFVRPGDYVWTHKGRLRPVTHVWCQGYQGDMVSLEVGWRAVRATPNHPMFDGQAFTPAGDLRPGDTLAEEDAPYALVDPAPAQSAPDFADFATVAFGEGPDSPFLALLTPEGTFMHEGFVYRRGRVIEGPVVPALQGRLRFNRGAAPSISGGDTLVLHHGDFVDDRGQALAFGRVDGEVAQQLRLRCIAGPFAGLSKNWKKPIAADAQAAGHSAQGQARVKVQAKHLLGVDRPAAGASLPRAARARQGLADQVPAAAQKRGDGAQAHALVVEEAGYGFGFDVEPVFAHRRRARLAQSAPQGPAADAQIPGYVVQGVFVVEVAHLHGVYIDVQRAPRGANPYVLHKKHVPKGVAISKVTRKPYNGLVYNLTVADDESYYAEGFCTHNCRCAMAYLPEGAGFDAKGRMQMGGALGVHTDPATLEEQMAHKSLLHKALAHNAPEVIALGLPLSVTCWAPPKAQAQWLCDGRILHKSLDIDALVGPFGQADAVYVIHGARGPDRVALGFHKALDAALAYQGRHPHSGIDSMEALSLAAFHDYLKAQDSAAPKALDATRLVVSRTPGRLQKGEGHGQRVPVEAIGTKVDASVNTGPSGAGQNFVLKLPPKIKAPTKRQDVGGIRAALHAPYAGHDGRRPVRFERKATDLYADDPAFPPRHIDPAAGHMDGEDLRALVARNKGVIARRLAERAAEAEAAADGVARGRTFWGAKKSLPGPERPGHKYISRKLVNGEWEYTYAPEPAPRSTGSATALSPENLPAKTRAPGFGQGPLGKKTTSGKKVNATKPGSSFPHLDFTAADHLEAAAMHEEHAHALEMHGFRAPWSDRRNYNAAAAKARRNAAEHVAAADTMAEPTYALPPSAALSPAERGHLDHYLVVHPKTGLKSGVLGAGDYHSFHDINRVLSEKASGEPGEPLEPREIKALASGEAINALIAKAKLPAPLTVYRGGKLPADLKVGDVFASPRITSTSEDKETARGYAQQAAYEGGRMAIMEIRAPEGASALSVREHYAAPWAEEMKEVIFASGQKMRVAAISAPDENHVRHVEMEVLKEPEPGK